MIWQPAEQGRTVLGDSVLFSGNRTRQYPLWCARCQSKEMVEVAAKRTMIIESSPDKYDVLVDDEQISSLVRNNWFHRLDLMTRSSSPNFRWRTSNVDNCNRKAKFNMPWRQLAGRTSFVSCPSSQDHQCRSDYCPQRWRGYWTWKSSWVDKLGGFYQNRITINLSRIEKLSLLQLFLSIKILITVFKNILDRKGLSDKTKTVARKSKGDTSWLERL